MKHFNQTARTLNPNLIGWFAIAFSSEVQVMQEKNGVINGEAYTLSRSKQGKILAHGIAGELVEQNNIIYTWRHPQGLAPAWYIPILDETGWSGFRHHQLSARTHPQEVYENSIDEAHFSVVHDFSELTVLQQPRFDEHCMSVRHQLWRKNPIGTNHIISNFEVRLYGLGCAYNCINIPSLGMQVRMFALTTPSQLGLVDIRIAVSIALKPLFRIFTPLIHPIIHQTIIKDFCQDLFIWENKCYRPSPLLVKGDGQINKFRQWCQQFYAKEKS